VTLAYLLSFTALTWVSLFAFQLVYALQLHAFSGVLTFLSLYPCQTVCTFHFLFVGILTPTPLLCFPECELLSYICPIPVSSYIPFSVLKALLSKLSSLLANVLLSS